MVADYLSHHEKISGRAHGLVMDCSLDDAGSLCHAKAEMQNLS
jgi:hypothetical protein